MDEEELCAGPEGVLLEDSDGGACFLVSRLELEAEVSGAAVGRVEVKDVHGVHDEDRPAEQLVHANDCRSCTSRSALQARWNKQVILLYSLYSRMVSISLFNPPIKRATIASLSSTIPHLIMPVCNS